MPGEPLPERAEVVSDPADPRVALYGSVRDPVLARSAGCFIAEGRMVVRRVIESGGYSVRSLLVTESAAGQLADLLSRLPPEVPIYVADLDVVRGVTGFNLDRGCLALVERPPARDWREVAAGLPASSTLLVLECIANPDNVGGVFRNAAAFGAAGVLLSPGCSDPLYRKAVRTSMAATLEVPFATLTPWPEGLAELRDLGIHALALAPRAGISLTQWCRRPDRPSRVALMIGNESVGLTDAALDQADARLSIPMPGGFESLNAAVASAVALYALASDAPSG